MTELPESTTVTGQYDSGYEPPNWLGQVAAWVAIVAGVVFVVAVIFLSGLFVGWSAGGLGGVDDRDAGQMGPGGMTGECPMMGPGGMMSTCPMMGGGEMMGPGQMRPGGMMGPSPSPTTTAPGTPRR